MKRLTPDEIKTARILMGRGSICLGDAARSELGQQVAAMLDSLVRKKRATVDNSDDGPVYRLNARGMEDAS